MEGLFALLFLIVAFFVVWVFICVAATVFAWVFVAAFILFLVIISCAIFGWAGLIIPILFLLSAGSAPSRKYVKRRRSKIKGVPRRPGKKAAGKRVISEKIKEKEAEELDETLEDYDYLDWQHGEDRPWIGPQNK
ncbi:MAG: hypothetical protein ABIJ27_02240 [Candidatus Omnitrophota bacterium]